MLQDGVEMHPCAKGRNGGASQPTSFHFFRHDINYCVKYFILWGVEKTPNMKTAATKGGASGTPLGPRFKGGARSLALSAHGGLGRLVLRCAAANELIRELTQKDAKAAWGAPR
jgi:hypothetical protein